MQQENQQDLFSNLNIDHEAKQHIRTMATWAMIGVVIAIIGYILSIVDIIAPREMPATRSEGFSSMFQMSSGSNIAWAVGVIIVGLVVNYFLYRFSILARRGVDGLHQSSFNNAFGNLKIYFMIASILSIIACVVACLIVFFFIGKS